MVAFPWCFDDQCANVLLKCIDYSVSIWMVLPRVALPFCQLLAKTPLGLTMSCFVVQVITDYIDRMITLLFVAALLKKLPTSLLHNLKRHAER